MMQPELLMGKDEFDVTHLSEVDNGKALKYSVFISRHALTSGSNVIGRSTVASAMRLVNHPG